MEQTPATLEPTGTSSMSTESRPDSSTASDTAPVLVAEELLVEEISIDGMCGVY